MSSRAVRWFVSISTVAFGAVLWSAPQAMAACVAPRVTPEQQAASVANGGDGSDVAFVGTVVSRGKPRSDGLQMLTFKVAVYLHGGQSQTQDVFGADPHANPQAEDIQTYDNTGLQLVLAQQEDGALHGEAGCPQSGPVTNADVRRLIKFAKAPVIFDPQFLPVTTRLPFTGFGVHDLAGVGAAIVLLGVALMVVARPRRA
jgi:hypothetical protein